MELLFGCRLWVCHRNQMAASESHSKPCGIRVSWLYCTVSVEQWEGIILLFASVIWTQLTRFIMDCLSTSKQDEQMHFNCYIRERERESLRHWRSHLVMTIEKLFWISLLVLWNIILEKKSRQPTVTEHLVQIKKLLFVCFYMDVGVFWELATVGVDLHWSYAEADIYFCNIK